MTHPTQEDDVKAIRDALADHSFMQDGEPVYDCCKFFKAANPARIARLLAHIDAQAVRLDAAVLAEREACAQICDSMPYRAAGAGKAAQAIRSRAAIASEAKT